MQDPNTALPIENAEYFATIIHDLQATYYVENKIQKCIDKINPFAQPKWAVKEFNYKAKVDEEPYYFI